MDLETLDKAAKQYLTTKGKYYDTSTKVFAYNGFKAGAEWQRNNIWHDVRNIPIKGSYIVVFTKHGSITSWFASNDIESVFKRFDVVAWAYAKDILPTSFDEILQENKDVLQRLK